MKVAPAAASDRPSTLPILCRNIAGGSSADSPPLLVVGGVYVASRQQAANRAARAKGKGLPALEDDDEDYEDYAAEKPQRARRPQVSVTVQATPARSPPLPAAPHVHAARRPERRALPSRSRTPARPHLAPGIRNRQVGVRSNPAARPKARSPKSVSLVLVQVYVGTGAFARPAKRSEARRYHDPRRANCFTPLRKSAFRKSAPPQSAPAITLT